jgi:hypothetical protein
VPLIISHTYAAAAATAIATTCTTVSTYAPGKTLQVIALITQNPPAGVTYTATNEETTSDTPLTATEETAGVQEISGGSDTAAAAAAAVSSAQTGTVPVSPAAAVAAAAPAAAQLSEDAAGEPVYVL